MKFKVERYTMEEGEIEADNAVDASTLMKYEHLPKMWKTIGRPTVKLILNKREVREISDDTNNKS
jgi:hypothetical protein